MLHTRRTKARGITAAVLGALVLISSIVVAMPAQALSDTGTGGVFVPTTGRILDTSKGTGGFSTPMAAGTYRTIKVTGLAGVPDDGTVAAVSLNATVGSAPDNGTLFGRPDGNTSRTTMLIYNAISGQYTSNSAVLAVGADGTIQVMTETSARLILDVQGYYTTTADGTAAGGFVPLAKRIVDTRAGLGAPKTTLAPGASVDVQVGGANGVPADASGAVVSLIALNTTVADGYFTPFATGATKPANSLHYAPSASTSIQAQVPLSAAGKMTIANSSTTTSLIVDLQGYFTASNQVGAVFIPAAGRAYDTRSTGNTPLAEQETRSIQIAGTAGVPAMGSGIKAVVLTLIVAHGGGNGYAEAWADGTTRPGTSVINFNTDEIQTNTITVPLGANGKIALRNAAKATNYVIDVQGWYVNPVTPTVTCPYGDGTTTLAIPTADFTCTVTAPASSASGQQLTTSVDGAEGSSTAMSDTASTTQRVTVPARGGDHEVQAQVLNNDGSVATNSTVRFHLGGDWAREPLKTLPADGAYASTGTWVTAEPANDVFSDDATVVYTISANADGKSDPVVTSGPVAEGYPVADGLLQDGQTYYWTAVISGTSAGVPATVETPVHQFVATSAKVSNWCAAALQIKAASLGVSRTVYVSTCAGDDSTGGSVAGDVDDEVGSTIADTSDASASTADTTDSSDVVTRAAGAVRAKYGSVNGHSRGYLWKSVMNVKWYYDGAHAWSKKPYRGVRGYQRCNTDGSYAVGATVDVRACGNYSPAGKDILYETVAVSYVFRGSPFSYVQSFHATITKTGATSAGSGVGF
jgi:hypothetical protein